MAWRPWEAGDTLLLEGHLTVNETQDTFYITSDVSTDVTIELSNSFDSPDFSYEVYDEYGFQRAAGTIGGTDSFYMAANERYEVIITFVYNNGYKGSAYEVLLTTTDVYAYNRTNWSPDTDGPLVHDGHLTYNDTQDVFMVKSDVTVDVETLLADDMNTYAFSYTVYDEQGVTVASAGPVGKYASFTMEADVAYEIVVNFVCFNYKGGPYTLTLTPAV